MTVEVKIPKLSPNMKEAVLVAWQKQVGDLVAKGDVIYEVETEKVVSEVEASCSGVLVEQLVEEGDRVSLDDVVAIMEAEV